MKKLIYYTLLSIMLCPLKGMAQEVTPSEIPLDLYLMIDSLEREYVRIEAEKAIQKKQQQLRFLEGLKSEWILQGQWGTKQAPELLSAGKYGTGNHESASGYWRGGFHREIENDKGRIWGVGYGFDWMRGFNYPGSRRQLNQAYIDVRWLYSVFSLGMKQQPDELGFDRLPLMQLRIATDGYQQIIFNDEWISLKGSIAYGLTTGQSWNRIYGTPHEGFRQKQAVSAHGAIRIGKRPLNLTETVQIGLSGHDDWKDSRVFTTAANIGIGKWMLSLFDKRIYGIDAPLWSPLLRLGKNSQGISVTSDDGKMSLKIEQNALCHWAVSARQIIGKYFKWQFDYMHKPELFTGYNYAKDGLNHAFCINLDYELPIREIPGICIGTTWASDFLKDEKRNGIQLRLAWHRSIY